MKKFTLILAMSSVLALSACSKEVTEVQKGSTVPAKAQQKLTLSTNNVDHIQSDMTSMQTLAMQQETQAGDLDQRLSAALQSEDNEAVKALFPEFKAAMQKNLSELNKLEIKSTEVNQLRQKLSEMMTVGLTMQEKLLDPNVQEENVKTEQTRLVQLQQELAAASMHINSLLSPAQPSANAALTDIIPEDAAAVQAE